MPAAGLAVLMLGTLLNPAVMAEEPVETGETAGEITELAEPYPLWVGGKQVTSDNAADVLGNKKVSYDAAAKKLTLDNAAFSTGKAEEDAFYGIFSEVDDLTVELTGKNTIKNDRTAGIHGGIYSNGPVVIAGEGSLDISLISNEDNFGISAGGLTIRNAALNIDLNGNQSKFGIEAGDEGLKLEHAVLSMRINGNTGSETDQNGIVLNDSDAEFTESELNLTVVGGVGLSSSLEEQEAVFYVDEKTKMTIDTGNGNVGSSQAWLMSEQTALVKDAEGERYTILPETEDLSAYVYLEMPYKMKAYSLVSGDNQTWTTGSEEGLTFTYKSSIFDEDTMLRFDTCAIDEFELSDDSILFDAKEDGTGLVLTVFPEELAEWEAGEHYLSVDFIDSEESVDSLFTIAEGKLDVTELNRMYNPSSGEHFYTGNPKEAAALEAAGWKNEGIGFTALKTSDMPVYRVYNPNAGDHHYTSSREELETLVKAGWKDEGVACYASGEDGTPLYRLYNPNAETGAHHFTSSKEEVEALVKAGWKDEGIAFCIVK